MRTYWLKIVLGAFAIFLIGYAGWTACRSAVTEFDQVAHSSDPLRIPLPFGILPFKVDSVRLGSIDRITLLRSEPEVITSVRLSVSLGDSVSAEQLKGCELVGRNITDLDEASSFHCLRSDTADSAAPETNAPGLRPFGVVLIGDLELPLLLSEADIRELQQSDQSPGEPFIDADSLSEAIQKQVDSATADALNRAKEAREMADSIKRTRAEFQPQN